MNAGRSPGEGFRRAAPLFMRGTFWDSSANLSVILNFLINAVADARGAAAAQRFELMREFGSHFKEFETLGR